MGVVEDLMEKIAEDVTRAMGRTLAICPDPRLPVALAGAAAALGIVTSLLDEMAGLKRKDGPSPENILLAGLLAARLGISGEDGVGQAYRDIEKLKVA
jgi:hypothetical protein